MPFVVQSKDLAASQPEKLKELDSLWQSWSTQLARPLWGQGRR